MFFNFPTLVQQIHEFLLDYKYLTFTSIMKSFFLSDKCSERPSSPSSLLTFLKSISNNCYFFVVQFTKPTLQIYESIPNVISTRWHKNRFKEPTSSWTTHHYLLPAQKKKKPKISEVNKTSVIITTFSLGKKNCNVNYLYLDKSFSIF